MNPDLKSAAPSTPGWSALKAMHLGKRERQEDAADFWEKKDDGVLFAVVADGAGGHGGGAEASTAAVAEAEKCWQVWTGQGSAAEFLADWMRKAHDAVNRCVRHQYAEARTVAVALMVHGDRADWVHAGDCRLYHFRQGKLLSRTRDDSVVQVLFEKGEIAEDEMGTHEDQNRLLQAIGGNDPPKPRRGGADIEPEDVLILCSDGFWERLKPEEIAELVTTPQHLRNETLEKALQLAVDRGAAKADNGSVIMSYFDEWHPPKASPSTRWGCRGPLVFLIVAAVAALAAFGLFRAQVTKLWQKYSTPIVQPTLTEPAKANQSPQINK
jgi:serine/threonine protein phosphatase PrpC